jgi:hypothetical protein
MNISSNRSCRTPTLALGQSIDTAGATIIHSRPPIFALTTALNCVLTACLLSLQGSLRWCVALTVMAALLGAWQIHVACNAPVLVIRGLKVTLYRSGFDVGSFVLSDLSIVDGNLTTGMALFVTALTSAAFGALGLSRNLDVSMSLSISPTKGLNLVMLGLWFAGNAISIYWLDFPRRKLLLRIASGRPMTIYVESRRQRDQLRTFLRDLQLKQVMLRVGLGSSGDTTGNRDTNSHHNGQTIP